MFVQYSAAGYERVKSSVFNIRLNILIRVVEGQGAGAGPCPAMTRLYVILLLKQAHKYNCYFVKC